MDVDLVRWLGSPGGRDLLRSLGSYAEARVPAESTRLRGLGLSAEQVAALLTQQRLRTRAHEKFGDLADDLLFTADGLEQASRPEVAAGHAERFAAAGLERVHDLGCGVGADAIALAIAGVRVEAIDADPVTAAIAGANLRPWPGSTAEVGLAEDFRPPADRDRIGAWLDPARRTTGAADIRGRTRRVFRLDDICPSWDVVRGIAAEVPATGVKLSPSFPHNEIPPGAESQWVSRAGTVLECAIWCGPLVRSPGRTARILRPGGPPVDVTEEDATDDASALTGAGGLGPWLYEVDRALVQAGLISAVTAATHGRELEAGVGYVTGDTAYDLPTARRYAVLDALPFHPKTLRTLLREKGIGGLTIKQRGVRIDEDTLRKQLKIGRRGGDQATVLLTPIASRPTALFVAADL
ncbi:class I SAM-dependent methyltransferase [Nostocoides australiense]